MAPVTNGMNVLQALKYAENHHDMNIEGLAREALLVLASEVRRRSGEHDNETLAKEICKARNTRGAMYTRPALWAYTDWLDRDNDVRAFLRLTLQKTTEYELSKRIGVTQDHLHDVLLGRQDPGQDILNFIFLEDG